MLVEWQHHIHMIISPDHIRGLNNAYGHVIRRAGKRLWAQRYLLPDAKEYKARWTRLFQLIDQHRSEIHNFEGLREREKPLLALKFSWVYELEHFSFKNGRLRGFDLSNLIKLVEDAYCAYAGVDDSRTVLLHSTKRPSQRFTTQCLLSVGYIKDDITAECDQDFNKDFEPIFGGNLNMPEVYKADLPCMMPYIMLTNDKKGLVDAAIAEHSTTPEIVQSVKLGLEELGSDTSMLLTMVGMLAGKGHLRPGLWEKLVAIMETDRVVDTKGTPRARTARPRPPEATRGALPFGRLPAAKQSAEEFIGKWQEKNAKKKQYPSDMLDWATGAINWDSRSVYTYNKGTLESLIYRALLEGKRTYDAIKKLTEGVEVDKVDKILKSIITQPAWLPPGAGKYCEDETTGEMWILRDPAEALALTLPWKE